VADQDRHVDLTANAASEALRPELVSGRRRLPLAWLGTLPFAAYTCAFLLVPAGSVMSGAFRNERGGWTLSNVDDLFHQPYVTYYWTSIKISLITALLGAALGLLLAYAASLPGTPRWVRSALSTFSGVAANFGGIPLAFAFIATIGTLGIVTNFLRDDLHWNIYREGFTLFGTTGIEIVYLYFQIPLMVLVIAPAIDGLRPEWREAASNLGASRLQYWRHVGLPILTPSLLGAIILLFGNAFAAYATAYSLTSGSIPLVPIVIGAYYTGNVLSNPHLAQALAFGMFVVLGVMMLIYVPLQRRSARWAR
jgi:putative spermidine/putrescine transport system permease protein